MQAGQQISVEEYYSMVLLEGAYCFICQKEARCPNLRSQEEMQGSYHIRKMNWTPQHNYFRVFVKNNNENWYIQSDQLQSCTGHIRDYPGADEDGENKQFRPHKY